MKILRHLNSTTMDYFFGVGKGRVKTLLKIKHYHLFMTCLKREWWGIGFEVGTEYRSDHFCTRDVDFIIGLYYFTFWIEDGR